MCVFYQRNYINLLKLLVQSISVKANIQKETTDLLIITSPEFQPLIQREVSNVPLTFKYNILSLSTLMEASCCKLHIFKYENIDHYDKILYLDTDVLINGDLNILFQRPIETSKLYALEEGNIGHEYWGSEFFDFSKYDRNTAAFSAGVFYFCNSVEMKQLFQSVLDQIHQYIYTDKKKAPVCLDQPFLVYNALIQDKYDNQLMKLYLENNPANVRAEKLIYHFPGDPGHYASKFDKMTSFWKKMNTIAQFDTRHDMLKYYCSTLSNPVCMEIGVFKGDFLDFLVNDCKVGSIDAVDLFEGITCSGDVDGNNVVFYDVGKSYVELREKYKHSSHVNIHKSDSGTFLQTQQDNTYDVIYIDGDHSYNGVKNDLIHAFNKIKNGGYIMGHDYEMNMRKAKNTYNFGVKEAVDEFCATYRQNILAKGLDGCVSYCMKIIK